MSTRQDLHSCQTLVDGTGMLGQHTGEQQTGELNLDDLIKVSCQLFIGDLVSILVASLQKPT